MWAMITCASNFRVSSRWISCRDTLHAFGCFGCATITAVHTHTGRHYIESKVCKMRPRPCKCATRQQSSWPYACSEGLLQLFVVVASVQLWQKCSATSIQAHTSGKVRWSKGVDNDRIGNKSSGNENSRNAENQKKRNRNQCALSVAVAYTHWFAVDATEKTNTCLIFTSRSPYHGHRDERGFALET